MMKDGVDPSQQQQKKTLRELNAIICNNRHLSIQMIAQMVNVDRETAGQILHEQSNMCKVRA